MEKENVVVNAEGKKAIILTSEGDLRHMPHPFKTTAHLIRNLCPLDGLYLTNFLQESYHKPTKLCQTEGGCGG